MRILFIREGSSHTQATEFFTLNKKETIHIKIVSFEKSLFIIFNRRPWAKVWLKWQEIQISNGHPKD